MKTKTSLLLTILIGISFMAVSPAFAQGTAFTYQGLLTTSNGPVNGTYDLTFALWDSSAGGAQVGNSITNPGWHVTGGQLTVPLDFGPNFSGTPLWLEIGVRTNGVGAFSTLSPRQALTPTPYAIYAESATGLANGVAIGSGIGNQVPSVAIDSFIGGGSNNVVYSTDALIVGGFGNQIGDVAHGAVLGGGGLNYNNGTYGTLGGGILNSVLGPSATVSGGSNNVANGPFATVGGGDGNRASGTESTVAGGTFNLASGQDATVGGGYTNSARGDYSFLGGGHQNNANGVEATVGGGYQNNASGNDATVPGGNFNTAAGAASFAAGSKASANHDNSFVWSDGAGTFGDPFGFFQSTYPQQFRIEAGNGVEMDVSGSHGVNPAALFINSTSANGVGLYVLQPNSSDACLVINTCPSRSSSSGGGDIIKGFGWTPGGFGSPNNVVFEVTVLGDVSGHSFNSTSDRNAKENFAPVSPAQILEKVNSLPVSQWNFKGGQSDVQHIGPMAQDFHQAFGLNGGDDKHISLTDEGGVALAAIQGLNQKLEDRLQAKDAEIQDLKARLEMLEERLIGGKGDAK
jgi:hypothetical protein